MTLNKNELLNIHGGGVSLGLLALIGAGIIFVIGMIDGYVNPIKCN